MILGIDTSNYTTSVAVCDENGKIISDLRRVLPVKPGGRGLRQSEALFNHVKNLPDLIKEATHDLSADAFKAVGVSIAPRPQENSYMPVFRAGYGAAQMLAATLHIPCYTFSHQEGHIRAALIGHEKMIENLNAAPFLAVHFSGGTSEIVLAEKNQMTAGYQCEICAESPDLHAGQLIDRIGVRLGLPFPAGKAMEELANQATRHHIKFPSSLSGRDSFHFSGLENVAAAALEQGEQPAEVSFAIFEAVGRTLGRAIVALLDAQPSIKNVVFSGGVMANSIIRDTVTKRVRKNKRFNRVNLIFSQPRNATDNAQGIALIARSAFLHISGE